jgi:serine/threonine-protein kinase
VVYRTYADRGQPTPTPGVTPVFTPVPSTTIVPQLVGLPLEAAQQEAARAGLGLIVEEREDPTHPVSTVLEQQPPAGQTVVSASQVRLVVSRRIPGSTIPDVWGFTLDEVRAGLQSRGWVLVTEQVWSSEPAGRIVQVEPPIGTLLDAGKTLTLTLSGGTDQPFPLEANLNNTIFLESAQLRADRFAPGEALSLVLRWRALQPVANSYIVFVHLIGPSGVTVAQEDREPRTGDASRPTNTWTPGVIVADSHSLTIPSSAANGTYQLWTGMYLPSNGERLPVLDAGRTNAQDHRVLIREIRIGP